MRKMKKGTYPQVDRRKYPRIKDDIIVKYTIASNRKIIREAKRQNIGGGGLKIITKDNLEKGNILALRIDLPGIRETLPIFATGKVIWREVIKDKKSGEVKYGVGIEFISIDKEDRQEIMEYIERNR